MPCFQTSQLNKVNPGDLRESWSHLLHTIYAMIIYYKIVFVRTHRVHATRVHIVFLLRAVPFMVEHVLNMDFIHLSKSKNTMIAHCDLFEKYEDVIFKKTTTTALQFFID